MGSGYIKMKLHRFMVSLKMGFWMEMGSKYGKMETFKPGFTKEIFQKSLEYRKKMKVCILEIMKMDKEKVEELCSE